MSPSQNSNLEIKTPLVCAVILAAGKSVRLGEPKQKIEQNNVSLLEKTFASIKKSCCTQIIIVIKSDLYLDFKFLENQGAILISNANSELGMSHSIFLGLQNARHNAEGFLFTVCDQPFLTTNHIDKLIFTFKIDTQQIIATQYQVSQTESILGAPAIFPVAFKKELLQLKWDEGARKIIQKNIEKVKIINCDYNPIDIDTPEDLEDFRAHCSQLTHPLS